MSEGRDTQGVERAIRRVLATARSQFGMEVAFVAEFVGGRRVFRFIDSVIEDEIVTEGGGDPLEDSFCARVVDGRLPQVLCDAGGDPEAQRLAATRLIPVGAHLSVPIRRADGSVFGTFCCFSRTADHSLGEHERAGMQMYAALVEDYLRLSAVPEPPCRPLEAASYGTRARQLRALSAVAVAGQILLGLCALDLVLRRLHGHDVVPAAWDYVLAVGGLVGLAFTAMYNVVWRSLRRAILADATELRQRSSVELAHRESHRKRIRRVEAAIGDARTLRIVFQPIYGVGGGSPIGHEALARFADGRPPNEWFAEAHAVGLGVELELGALVRAVDSFDGDGYLSVNLSPIAVQTHAVAALLSASPHTSRLVIEITEHAAIDDYQALAAAIGSLRRLGARLAIDDAGSGFASMRHVVALHPDIVKIDRALVAEIDVDESRQAMVRSLADFAHEIHAKVIAEGVERAEELRACRDLGVDAAQGYLLGRPQRRLVTDSIAAPDTTNGIERPAIQPRTARDGGHARVSGPSTGRRLARRIRSRGADTD